MSVSMVRDNLHFDSREKLTRGIEKIARAVGVTMGTGGSNALIEAIESPGHLATNDGYSIANAIQLADPIENMGRNLLLEAINKANKNSGDGSSTTCVLTAATISEGLKYVDEAHPMEIKRSLEELVPTIEELLADGTKPIVNGTEFNLGLLQQVATVSAEDSEIGNRIAGIYEQIGAKGIIYWDVSKTGEDHFTIGTGITIEGAGWFSPYMCDATESGQSTNQIRIKNPQILLCKQKIATSSDVNTLAESLNNDSIKDLVIFADDIDPLVVPDLIKTRMLRGFRVVLVKMPVLWKDWWFEDLAKATGATVIDAVAGLPLKNARREHLGTVGNIVVTKDETYLDGIKDVKDYVEQLEISGDDDAKLRASRLNTKTARYYVGAQSESALSYRRLKVEDAIGAAYQALNGGIVAGGGVALSNVANKLPDTIGGKILKVALRTPFHVIIRNAGFEWEKVDPTLKEEMYNQTAWGYNSKTHKWGDMFSEGIVDPHNVVMNAVRNAVSVAAVVLTAPTIVTLPRDEQPVSLGNNAIIN